MMRDYPGLTSIKGWCRYLARLHETIRDDGFKAALMLLAASLSWRLSARHMAMRKLMRENEDFDARYGISTGGEMPLENVGVSSEDAIHGNGVYRAIPESYFREALSHLHLPFDKYTFLDYGSGKGKALLLASTLGFRSVIGIEYSETLHQAALLNLKHHADFKTNDQTIEALHADARTYELPGDPLVCFFFNPFDSITWRAVLTRIRISYELNPRPIHIVYVNVRDVDELEDFFPEFDLFSAVMKNKNVRILSAIPSTL